MAESTRSGGSGIAWLAIFLAIALGAGGWYLQNKQGERIAALTKEVLALKKADPARTAANQIKNVAGQLKKVAGDVAAISSSVKSLEGSVKNLGAKLEGSVRDLNAKIAGIEKKSEANDTRTLREQMARALADIKKTAAGAAQTNAAMIALQKTVTRISAQVKKLETSGAGDNKEN